MKKTTGLVQSAVVKSWRRRNNDSLLGHEINKKPILYAIIHDQDNGYVIRAIDRVKVQKNWWRLKKVVLLMCRKMVVFSVYYLVWIWSLMFKRDQLSSWLNLASILATDKTLLLTFQAQTQILQQKDKPERSYNV